MIDVAGQDFDVLASSVRARGFMPRAYHVRYDTKGEHHHSVVWHKPEKVLTWIHWSAHRNTHEESLKRPGFAQDNGAIQITNSRYRVSLADPFTAEMWFRCTELTIQDSYILMGTLVGRDPQRATKNAAGWCVTAGLRQNSGGQHYTGIHWTFSGSVQGSFDVVDRLGTDWHHLAVCNAPDAVQGRATTEVFLAGRRTLSVTTSIKDVSQKKSDLYLGQFESIPVNQAFLGDIKSFHLSSSSRYRGSFTPDTVFTSDDKTLALLDFDSLSSSRIPDISGANRDGIVRGVSWINAAATGTTLAASLPEIATPKVTVTIERLPLPSKADRKSGSEKLKEIFASELSAARDNPAYLELAEDFLSRGIAEEDAVAKFALLYESRELALSANNVEMALKTTAELYTLFKTDEWTLKRDALKKLADTARTSVERRQIATTALDLMQEAIDNSDWESAKILVIAAIKASSRLKDANILRITKQKTKQIEVSQKLSKEAALAETTLVDSPGDAVANLNLGRYLCFIQAEWDKGLLHLAKGSNQALVKLAEQDNEKPQGGAALALANDWYDWSKRAPDADESGAMLRARHWYDLALPDLTGLDHTVATKKLDELQEKIGGHTAIRQLNWLNGPVGELKRFDADRSVVSVDVNRAGTMLVTGSSSTDTVQFWDLSTGKQTDKIKTSVSTIKKVVLIGDDQFVLVIGSRTQAEVWNVRKRQPATAFTIPSSLRDVELSGDKKYLVCARASTATGNISIYKMPNGVPLAQLTCPIYANQVGVSRTGRLVAAASADSKVYVWNLLTKKPAGPFIGLTGSCSDIAISPDEKLVAAAANYTAVVWELATGKIVCRTNSSDASIRKLRFSPDNRRLLCAGRMKEICVVNVADGSVIQKLTGATSGSSYASDLIYLPDPRGAVSVGFGSTTGGLIRVWRLPD
jgi:WD40 repeat protein